MEGNKDEHSTHKNQTLSRSAFLYYHSLVMIIGYLYYNIGVLCERIRVRLVREGPNCPFGY